MSETLLQNESAIDRDRSWMEASLPPHGHVKYMRHLGTDKNIAEAARTSYGRSESKTNEDDQRLINRLYRDRHTSPFEQCSITFHIKMPIFLMRQFVRHRTFRLNEWSGRYSELKDEFFSPAEWRANKDPKNKQGSVATEDMDFKKHYLNETLEDFHRRAFETYQNLLENGVAKELARIVLPVSTYTQIVVNCDLHNLAHFFRLRCDSHAQKEMQDIALAMKAITAKLFPWTMAAYERFQFKVIDTKETSVD